MSLLDSDVHFWDPRHLSHPWLAEVPPLNRAFTPEDLAAQRPEPVDVVFVEAGRAAHQAGAGLDRIRRAARHRPWIRGAVAHADLLWRQAPHRLARHGNVVCELSGLATESAPGTARPIIAATLREAPQIFGPGRCMYGSDWPVMTLATDYGSWLDLVRAALAAHEPEAADAVLYGNAARIYRVDRTTPLIPNGT